MSSIAERTRRKKLFAKLPWVTEIKKDDVRCEGVKWSTVALRDIYSRGDVLPRGISAEKSQCKRRAIFRYKLASSTPDMRTVKGLVREGNFCWGHASMIVGDYERKRVEIWIDRYGKEAGFNG